MLLFNIDGPKGSGKSTLATELSKRFNAKHEYFDSERVVVDSDFENLDENDVIFERGMFSYMIYGFLWNAQQKLEMTRHFSNMTFKTWAPLSEKHFEKLYDNIKYYSIILYSSDEELLFKRIDSRFLESGKGATSYELSQLIRSNQLFKAWGSYYKYVHPEKTLLIDVSQYQSIEELANYIETQVSLHKDW